MSPSAQGDSGDVGRRTVRGMAWAYGSYVGGRGLVLVSTVILARVLTPSDFGVVALALTFMVFLDTVKDLGLGQALIIAPARQLGAWAQTAFGWSIVLGLGLTVATVLAAPLAAGFFHKPQLSGLLSLLGLNFLLRSFGATHLALARRRLDYRSRTASELADVITRGTISIALALAGLGPMALVIGYLAGSSAAAVMIWHRVAWRPRARISTRHLRGMASFGGVLTLVDVGQAFAHELDYLFIGRVLGTTPLGLYSIGFRLPELLIVNLSVVAGGVLFPAYALMDRERLRAAYLVSLRYTALLVLPMAVGLGFMARPVLLTLFGSQWEPAVPVMQVLCIYAVVVTLNIPAGTVYKVTGRAWILIAFTVPYVALLVVALSLFSSHGILAVATVMAAMQGIFSIAGWTVASHMLDASPRQLLRALGGPVAAAVSMAVPLGATMLVVHQPLIALVLGTAVGGASYAFGVRRFAPDAIERLRGASRGGSAGPTGSAGTPSSPRTPPPPQAPTPPARPVRPRPRTAAGR
jgi:O-antigen/teichoic acid export membrane protein